MNENLQDILPVIKGRGSSLKVANRFEQIHLDADFEQLDEPDQFAELTKKVKTEYFFDHSETIVSTNHSPDVDFNFSLNPYRGCEHGCSYCYARPSHEYLGFNAGIDFESKIIVKPDAAILFRKWLQRKKWTQQIEPVMLSGVTDCYQPCEKEFRLTRGCLEVALEMRQPMRITTKNGLVRRDIDLLTEMAKLNLILVTVSLTSLDQALISHMEPRSSSPQARLDTIGALSAAGVPVKVLVAPIIPSINEQEIPDILEQVANAGATTAGYVMLRLPLSVEPVFLGWVERNFPDRKTKIIGRLESLGGGKRYDSAYGSRMKGKGIWAEQIRTLFDTYCRKYGLERKTPTLACDLFRAINNAGCEQLRLF